MIPTYQRPSDFERCLRSLDRQQRVPDEVVVLIRNLDVESREVLARWKEKPYLRVVELDQSGQVKALNAGLEAVTGEVVMITDDDAEPHEDWCKRVEEHFINDPNLGGVGGRDIVYAIEGLLDGKSTVTGRVRWWGRLVGNHHLIAPAVTSVDILKGANMSYRMAAIGNLRFDMHLRGVGAQVGNDMAFSMALAAKGWKLIYDPGIQVNHYPGQRSEKEIRNALNLDIVENTAFNTWWALRHHLRKGPRRYAALVWESAIGTWGRPGWLRGWFAYARRDQRLLQVWAAARKGRLEAKQHEKYLHSKK